MADKRSGLLVEFLGAFQDREGFWNALTASRALGPDMGTRVY